MKASSLFIAFLLSGASFNTFAITPAADIEVTKLLSFVGKSGCTFIRSGNSYTAVQAQEHLTMKYGKARSKISSAEDFINEVASKSYLTGKAYQINCSAAPAQPTGNWLHAELKRLRSSK